LNLDQAVEILAKGLVDFQNSTALIQIYLINCFSMSGRVSACKPTAVCFMRYLSRRDDTYWNGNKKVQPESEVRLGQGTEYNRQPSRFSNFNSNSRERGRFQEQTSVQSNNFDR